MSAVLQRCFSLVIALGVALAVVAPGQESVPPGAGAGAPQEKPAQGRTEREPAAQQEKPRISDLTDPMRTIWPKTKADGSPRSADELLRMVPGRGGDALAGLVESERDLSPDLRLLLDFSRNPANDARQRAATLPPESMKPFLLFNTVAVPRWGEKEQRDALGRITSMTDALGNRTNVRYDERGFAGVQAEPVGPLNLQWGDAGRLIQQNPERGAFEDRPIFDYTPFEYRARMGARLGASPLSHATEQRIHPDGGRSFVVYDLMGRPIYSYDSQGRLSLNHYAPGGQLMGTYDAQGRLTLYGQDRLGRRNFAVDSEGNRVLVDQDRQGSGVLGTAAGNTIKAGGSYVPARPLEETGGAEAGREPKKENPPAPPAPGK